MKLAKRTYEIKEAAMATMSNLSRQLKAQGHDVIALSLGEPDFQTPDYIKSAAHLAIDQNYSHYSPLPGFADLRQAVCDKFLRDNGLKYSPNQIVVSTGAKQSIMNALFAILDPGDEVILPAPYWASYYDMITFAGGKPVVVKAGIDDGFKVNPKMIEENITSKTKLLIFNSPNNPGGTFYHDTEVDEIANLLEKYPDIYVISDEVYENFVYTNERPRSLATYPQLYNRTIVVNGVSKSYAMTGWRIGYIGANEEVARACDTIQGQITSGANAIAQRAALAAILPSPETVAEIDMMRTEFKRRRDYVYSRLHGFQGFNTLLPEGAFYIFPDVSALFQKKYQGELIGDSNNLSMLLLNHLYVSTTPGTAFGSDECLRLSYANSMEELEKAMNRIGEFVNELTD